MDEVFQVKEEKSQKNLKKEHHYENFTTKARFVELLYVCVFKKLNNKTSTSLYCS